MNLQNVKLKWTWCKIVSSIGVTFWALETTFFMFKYGWHFKAFTGDEKICDKIASGILSVALILFVLVWIDIISYLLRRRRN